MGTEPMKLVCNKTLNGVEILAVVTTANGNQGQYVKAIAGVGNPFWIWPSIPAGQVIACDFTNAPIVNSDPAVNNALIAAITATPEEVLTYAE